MPAQSSISSLMPLSARTDATRARPGNADDRFSRLMESSSQTGSSVDKSRSDPASLREAHAARDAQNTRAERGDASRGGGASADAGKPAESGQRADGLQGRADSTAARGVPEKKGSADTPRGSTEAGSDVGAVNGEDALKEARSLLAELSDEDWSQLSEEVKAVLQDLKARVDAGDLDPSLEASLSELMADLEAGAPLDSIMQQLQAIPMDQLPSLAARFPDARTLGDVLGKRGAAYLTQLSAIASNAETAKPSAAETVATLTSASAGGNDKLDLNALLEAGKQGARTPRQEFGWLMNELAQTPSGGAKAVDLGASATAASSTAQLESTARAQPIAATDRQFTVQSEVRVPVGQSQWGQAVGQRVLWMASQKLSSAELRLDPPDLGPMQVRVSSHQDQISVTFTSAQPAVREALDQNATRLREMFAEQGLDLVDVNVSDQSGGDASGESGEGGAGRGGHHPEEPEGPVVEQVISDRLVDHYA